MSIWDVQLDTLRASRLLALRMHVARYLVSTGAAQRSAIALVDEHTLADRGAQLLELLEAAGAVEPRVMPLPSATEPLPVADVILIGQRGRAPADIAPRWPDRGSSSAGQVWAIDVDHLTAAPDEKIVDRVEALIRIVIPEALGANGTPPAEAVAVRLA